MSRKEITLGDSKLTFKFKYLVIRVTDPVGMSLILLLTVVIGYL